MRKQLKSMSSITRRAVRMKTLGHILYRAFKHFFVNDIDVLD